MSLIVNEVICGDALTVLREMPDGVIQTCITSPPFWGLRDYGTATWDGGDPACDHRPPDEAGQTRKPTSGQRQHAGRFTGPTCYKCGAIRIDQQLGLEPTPEEYVAKMVEVFAEVRRVLRDDGTIWLNLGDSYAANRGSGSKSIGKKQATNIGANLERLTVPDGLKEKDLVGIPWRIAFALQGFAVVPYQSFYVWADQLRQAREAQDWEAVQIVEGHLRFYGAVHELLGRGWYLRSDIIWSKLNPMPESVTDRPTKSHEYLFLLSKSPKYYYDADAIREPNSPKSAEWGESQSRTHGNSEESTKGGRGFHRVGSVTTGRNKRSVWTVATQPFTGCHFATFPEKLIEPCILAGCPEGGIILDPFFGSGTVGKRAKELGRRWIGIDLNLEYCEMARLQCCQEELF